MRYRILLRDRVRARSSLGRWTCVGSRTTRRSTVRCNRWISRSKTSCRRSAHSLKNSRYSDIITICQILTIINRWLSFLYAIIIKMSVIFIIITNKHIYSQLSNHHFLFVHEFSLCQIWLSYNMLNLSSPFWHLKYRIQRYAISQPVLLPTSINTQPLRSHPPAAALPFARPQQSSLL